MTITSEVKSKLRWSKNTEGLATDVDTRLGVVTLKGTANSAEATASSTRGVHSVNNQLVVDTSKLGLSEKVGRSEDEAEQKIADSWITTKVKSSFLYSRSVDGFDIEVSTIDGVVTLSGKLDSGAECALAIEIAQNVRGVKSVESSGLTY